MPSQPKEYFEADPETTQRALENLPPRYSDRKCPTCGRVDSLKVMLIDQEKTPCVHWGRAVCTCGHMLTWIRQPQDPEDDTATKRRSESQLRSLLLESGRDLTCCELCLIRDGEGGQHLVIHHVVEVKDGGTDSPENLRVYCVDCHSTVHTGRHRTRRLRGQNIHSGKPKNPPCNAELRQLSDPAKVDL